MLTPGLPELRDIQTPALVLDRDALGRNIAAMAFAASASGIGLRPHAKTHKSPRIAQMQFDAGALGISCATVAEIEALARAGLSGLLLTSPVADRPKLERLARVARDSEIAIVADHADQVEALGRIVDENSRPVRVLVDIDVGQKRTGVCDHDATIALATLVAKRRGMRFGGIQGFAGQVQHLVDADARKEAAAAVGGILNGHLQALRSAGFEADIVTGSGTGAASFDSRGPYTELQVGSYVFMDADYGKLIKEEGGALPYEPSLFVLATVTSVNRPGEFTIDAGVKALAFNGPMPDLIMGAPARSTYRFCGDEHGIITMPAGSTAPQLGSRVLVLTTHCDPTVNLHSCYHVVGHNAAVEQWPVAARYGD